MTASGFWRSDDGQTWDLINTEIRSPDMRAIAADPSNRGRVIAVGCGAYESLNFGVDWRPIGRGLPQDCSLSTVEVSPRASGYLYASGAGGLYRSDSDANGVFWKPSGQGIFSGPVVLAFGEMEGDLFFFCAPRGGGLFRTLDRGVTWTGIPGPPDALVQTLHVIDDSTVFAGTDRGLFQKSGSTWIKGDAFFDGLSVEWLLHTFYADYAATAAGVARRINFQSGRWENFDAGLPILRMSRVFNDPTGRFLMALPASGEGLYAYRYGLPTLRFQSDQSTVLVGRVTSVGLTIDPQQPAAVPISVRSSDPQVLMAYDTQINPFQPVVVAPLYPARTSTEPVGLTARVSADPSARAVTTLVRVVNPRPEVMSTDPQTLPAGSPGTSLLVFDSQYGLSFVADSVVYWNGSSRATRHGFTGGVCPDRCLDFLVIDLRPDDLALPGTARLSVVNPSPGGGESNVFSFRIGPASVRPPVKRPTGARPAPPVKKASGP